MPHARHPTDLCRSLGGDGALARLLLDPNEPFMRGTERPARLRFSDAGHRRSRVWAWGRRTKTAQAGTRGAAAMVYGDFEFCLAVVMAEPAGRWNRREPGE